MSPLIRVEGYQLKPRHLHLRDTPLFALLRAALIGLPCSQHINITLGSGFSVNLDGKDDPYIQILTVDGRHRAEIVAALRPLGFDLEYGDLASFSLADPLQKQATAAFLAWASGFGANALLSLGRLTENVDSHTTGTYVGCIHNTETGLLGVRSLLPKMSAVAMELHPSKVVEIYRNF